MGPVSPMQGAWVCLLVGEVRFPMLQGAIKSKTNKQTTQASLMVQWLRICLAMKGHQFDPWFRKIPHSTEQLSPRATTTEPTYPRARALLQEKPEH